MNNENFYEMLENIQRGVDIKLAMRAFGISKKHLEPWHKKEMAKAKAQATISMQQIVHEHGSQDWRALQWIIERNNRNQNNEQQLEAAINKQIAREVAKGLIESGLAGEIAGTGSHQGVPESQSEDSGYSEGAESILRLPRDKTKPPADGDF
jgi:hypothetical protein